MPLPLSRRRILAGLAASLATGAAGVVRAADLLPKHITPETVSAVKKGLESLSQQQDDEMDRLDQAFDVKPVSRLACQSKIDGDDLEVFITEESLVAYMDENPDTRRKLIAEQKWPVRK